MLGLEGRSGLTTPHHLGDHARQAVRSHITTLGPGAVFGTQADVFYEIPLWEKLQLIHSLPLMNSSKHYIRWLL